MIKRSLVFVAMLLSLAISVQATEITTAVGNGADTYLSNDSQQFEGYDFTAYGTHGGEPSIRMRNLEGVRMKLGYIRFDISQLNSVEDAMLALNVVWFKGVDSRLDIYALVNESLDNWDEMTICYNNAPGFVPTTQGVPVGYYDITEDLVKVAEMAYPDDSLGYIYSTPSIAMNDFINNDTNGLVTFAIIPDPVPDADWDVSSKEDSVIYAPKLVFEEWVTYSGILEIPMVHSFPKDTLLIPLNVFFPTGATFSSAEINIGGYLGLLDFIEIDTSNSLTGAAGWMFHVNETDTLFLTASAGADNISGAGVLFWLKFAVPGTASGFIPITLESAIFNTGDIPFLLNSGGVTIPDYGDVDFNGLVQAYDASLILKYLVDYISLDEVQQYYANVTLDTTISALDASMILQYVVGLIDSLPYDTTSGSLFASGDVDMEDGEIQAGQQV